MTAATILVGMASGAAGGLLGLLLHLVQHVAFDYSLGSLIGGESFLEGVSAASPLRRFLVLSLCGIVAGTGWWAVYRYGRKLVSVSEAVGDSSVQMPAVATTAHVLLQIVTVAMGSPLGREVAPREMGALLAAGLSRLLRVAEQDRRILVACGAGAGLAAVYNVPFGGALFTIEVLLRTFSVTTVVPAITTSVIAAYVARIGLGNQTQYAIPNLVVTPGLVIWAIVAGPVYGVAAHFFSKATSAARLHAPREWRLPIWCLAIFSAIGACAVVFPQILGNGKGIAQLGFAGDMSIGLAIVLLMLRVVVTVGALRAGAEGGLLTPSIATGTLLAAVLGGVWNLAWPGAAMSAFAVVGAAAFLAAAMRMPITAVALVIEFTHVDSDFAIPLLFAVAASAAARELCRSAA